MNKLKLEIARLVIMGLAFICISSCKKEKIEDPIATYVIEGHLYEDCNMEPIEGLELFLIQSVPNGFLGPAKNGGTLDSSTTDSLGYYKFNFHDKNGFELLIRYRAGYGYNYLHKYIPKETSFFDYNLFVYPTFNMEVSLNIINPYTENDTLYIQDNATIGGFKMPGPFKSGFAFKTEQAIINNMSLKENGFSLVWGILPYRGVSYAKYFTITEYCNNTVYVTIDIE